MITSDPTVVERYAQAFFNAVKKQNAVDAVLAESEALLKLFEGSSRLRVFVESPNITTEAKTNLIDKVFKADAQPLVHSLLVLLLRKGRVSSFSAILDRFRLMAEREQGIFEGTVHTAAALDESERTTLLLALEKHMKARLRLTYQVDPALIGGVKFRSGDTLIDDSVLGKLDRLRGQLQQVIR